MNVPEHVAIILDGNGRWAKEKGMPRNYGHMQGAKAVEDILVDARDIGIKYLTVYAFSTENWTRPEAEVSALMTILRNYLKTSIKKSMKNNVRCRVIGERSKLSPDIQDAINDILQIFYQRPCFFVCAYHRCLHSDSYALLNDYRYIRLHGHPER